MFEEAWLGVGGTAQQTVLMEAPLKTTDARRGEEGGQGRVCLSLCVCVGQCPTVSLGAPLHMFALMASVPAAFWPRKTALQPRLHAHSLITQAATLSYTMHTAYTHTRTPPHTFTSTKHRATYIHMQLIPRVLPVASIHLSHTPPHSAKPGSHTHLPHIHVSTHTYLTRSYHTFTHTLHLDFPVTPMSHLTCTESFSHTP